MNRNSLFILFAVSAIGTLSAPPASAYPVGPALTLEKMTEAADVIVKATVISNELVEDAWFEAVPGFKAYATKLQVISSIKGDAGVQTIVLRHYATAPTPQGEMYTPKHYELAVGRSYILFANKTDAAGVYRQLSKSPTSKEDESVLLAADESPRTEKSVKPVYWSELTGLLGSADGGDVVYAIHQLDQMSGIGWDSTPTFERKAVAEAIRPLLVSKVAKVSEAAITCAGSRNPYTSADHAIFWLATVGHGHIPGLGLWDPKFDNVAGRVLWPELANIADSKAPAATRAMAIRALGRIGEEQLNATFERWAADPEELVRQAAVVLLADAGTESAHQHIVAAAADASATVRQAAAEAIGFGQIEPLLPQLGKLLKDNQPAVRGAAAMSLLSFSVTVSGDLLRANKDDKEYRGLFVNALATADPAPYVADLGEIISKDREPTNFWGGFRPGGDAWNILFKYVQSRSAAECASGRLDPAFAALESMEWHSSSEPRDLYALYLQRGLADRAQTFRAKCRKAVSYDIDYYFNMVDKSPGTYKRE